MLLQAGCLPAGAFTSARPIPHGTFEHVASVEGVGAQFGDGTTLSGGVPSYGLRYGATDRVEIGGRVSPLSLEASAKVGLIRTEGFALAVAPRLTSTSGLLLLAVTHQPYAVYARLPVLVTVQLTDWASLTPRAGIGYAVGSATSWAQSAGDFGLATNEHALHDPVVEGGGTLLFRLAPTVSLGVDGYAVSTFLDDEVLTGGGGVAVLFTPAQETQR